LKPYAAVNQALKDAVVDAVIGFGEVISGAPGFTSSVCTRAHLFIGLPLAGLILLFCFN
jgi:hypothetical protein